MYSTVWYLVTEINEERKYSMNNEYMLDGESNINEQNLTNKNKIGLGKTNCGTSERKYVHQTDSNILADLQFFLDYEVFYSLT